MSGGLWGVPDPTGEPDGETLTTSGGSRAISLAYPLVLDSAGANPKALAVVTTRITGGTTKVAAALNWKERR